MKTLKFLFAILVFVYMLSSCKKDLDMNFMNNLELKKGNSGNDKLIGFDQWDYKWNAHHFNGYFINA